MSDPSVTHTIYLSDFDEDDLIERLKGRGYEITKNGRTPETWNDPEPIIPEWLEDEADRIYRQHTNLPRDVRSFIAKIIGGLP